jgi:hypothetical protein
VTLYRLMNQSLTVQTVGGSTLDAYGSTIPTPVGAGVTVWGYLEQTATVEFLSGRETTVTTWQAYLLAGTVIGPMDFITYQGQRFQVSGEPWHVFNPRTSSVSHIQCKLTEVT